jgi:thymidine kinase
MAKLHFIHSVMNAGKSTALIQVHHNYTSKGMKVLPLTAAIDDRYEVGRITSRIGLSIEAFTFSPGQDLMAEYLHDVREKDIRCVLVDEAQFLEPQQVLQLAECVDDLDVPVMAFSLRSDFRGNLFPGSAALFAVADRTQELRTECFCGKKATTILRRDGNGTPLIDGPQVQIGEAAYESVCRQHWKEAHRAAGNL